MYQQYDLTFQPRPLTCPSRPTGLDLDLVFVESIFPTQRHHGGSSQIQLVQLPEHSSGYSVAQQTHHTHQHHHQTVADQRVLPEGTQK